MQRDARTAIINPRNLTLSKAILFFFFERTPGRDALFGIWNLALFWRLEDRQEILQPSAGQGYKNSCRRPGSIRLPLSADSADDVIYASTPTAALHHRTPGQLRARARSQYFD